MLGQNVLSAISATYHSIYLVNIEKDAYIDLRTVNRIEDDMVGKDGAQEYFNTIIRLSAVSKYFDALLDFYCIDMWDGLINDSNSYSMEYERNDIGWVRTSLIVASRDNKDRITHVVVTTQEINGQKKTEQTLQKALEDTIKANRELLFNRSVMHQLGDEYFTVFFADLDDDTFRVEKIDNIDQIRSALGNSFYSTSFSEAVRLYINHYVVPEEQQRIRETFDFDNLRRELELKKSITLRYNCILASGEIVCIETHIVKVNDGVSDGGIILGIRNVEEEVRAQRQQKKALTDALDKANKASLAKTEFLNNMAHDIRTPMNAIIGFTDLAKESVGDIELVSDYLNKISVSSNHLLSLINDVLEMGRIESGNISITPEEMNLKSLVDEIGMILNVNAEKKNIDLSINTENINNENVYADKLRLSQMLINIVSNSIKFTEENGQITVDVSQDGDKYTFKVSDTGIGIKPEFIDHIFEPFSRESSSTISQIQGTGLGMAITKSLVDMMEGSIMAQSQVGQGTTFTVEIPLKASDAKAIDFAEKEEETGVSLEGRRVLLVEDNELNREIAEVILTKAGMSVVSACDGTEAVSIMAASKPFDFDMILMDIQMPKMNGYEATSVIRDMEDPGISQIPIIAVTANVFEYDRENAFAAKMDAHIPKPIDIKLLTETLKEILKIKGLS